MKDLFQEIVESIRRNKLRTCLTGLAVAWGIFMLIVLLGAGNGLINSFNQGSDTFATNTMMIGGGFTSKPYDGLKSGRRIRLDENDINLVNGKAFSDVVDEVTGTISASVTASLDKKHFSGSLEGIFPERVKMEKFNILSGRFINQKDIDNSRKVVVLADNLAEKLLPDGHKPISLIGKYIKLDGFMFKVVGITKADQMDNSQTLYAPYTTVQTVFNKGKEIGDLTFSFHGLETEKENEDFEKDLRAAINLHHRAAPDDNRAIWIWNRFTQDMQMNKANRIITVALWILGIFTLLSGIVGVSNIMLITVKERTHEFGIRKAIGARPWSITKLIIAESVTITAFFGYIGMLLGMVACEVMDSTLGSKSVSLGDEFELTVFIDPTVGLDVAIEATLLLIIAGTIAGLVPALKASKVKPIEALRAE